MALEDAQCLGRDGLARSVGEIVKCGEDPGTLYPRKLKNIKSVLFSRSRELKRLHHPSPFSPSDVTESFVRPAATGATVGR